MADLANITNIPGVKSAVAGDLAGVFHAAVREQDGEALAAVMGFVSSALVAVGEQLGLGALHRFTVAGAEKGCVVIVTGDAVTTASVEPARSLPAVEKVLDSMVQGKV